MNIFDDLRVSIDKHSVLIERNISRLSQVTHNTVKQEEIIKKSAEFGENVAAFKEMISNIANNDEPTKPASDFYANVLIQSAIELTNLKFVHREVIDDGTNYVCELFDYLPSDLEIANEINVVNFNVGTVDTNPPEPIVSDYESKQKTKAPKAPKSTRTNRASPKNKTVRKSNVKDITHVLDDVFQTLIIEDRLSSIKPSEMYKLIEDTYKIPDVKDNYKSIIKNFLAVRLGEWEVVRNDLIEVSYNMMQSNIQRGRIIEQLKLHDRTRSEDEPIQYEKYKRIIDEVMRRYEILLDSIPDTEPKPKPDWPEAV